MRAKLFLSKRCLAVALGAALAAGLAGCASAPRTDEPQGVDSVFPTAVSAEMVSLPGGGKTERFWIIRGPAGLLGYVVHQGGVSRSGPLVVSVALDRTLEIRRVDVIRHAPGPGMPVRSRLFTSQFEGKTSRSPIRVGEDIDAVTGATISSVAVADAVRGAIGRAFEWSAFAEQESR